jgi:nicotinamidase-related amidase
VAGKANARSKRRVGTASLEREQAVYNKNLPRWLKKHEHTHVLIKGGVTVGFYGTRDEALAAGYEQFGVVPLFVKQVEASDPVYRIPNVLL